MLQKYESALPPYCGKQGASLCFEENTPIYALLSSGSA
jgi:hypothetical protein